MIPFLGQFGRVAAILPKVVVGRYLGPAADTDGIFAGFASIDANGAM
jgi:hypothetical protein